LEADPGLVDEVARELRCLVDAPFLDRLADLPVRGDLLVLPAAEADAAPDVRGVLDPSLRHGPDFIGTDSSPQRLRSQRWAPPRRASVSSFRTGISGRSRSLMGCGPSERRWPPRPWRRWPPKWSPWQRSTPTPPARRLRSASRRPGRRPCW